MQTFLQRELRLNGKHSGTVKACIRIRWWPKQFKDSWSWKTWEILWFAGAL